LPLGEGLIPVQTGLHFGNRAIPRIEEKILAKYLIL